MSIRNRGLAAAGALACLILPAVPATASTLPADHPTTNTATCTVAGTEHNDVLIGTPGNDIICGYGGNDILWGNGGNDELWAGPGNDTLIGGAGFDQLQGGEGNDRLYDSSGRSWSDGEAGIDTCILQRGSVFRSCERSFTLR